MEIWQAIVFGAVQGFAEFLPISSSGHLIMLQRMLDLSSDGLFFFNIMLHIGTLIPVVFVLWKQILEMLKKPYNKFLYWVLASVPAGIVGLGFHFIIDLDALFTEHSYLLSITFILTALELLYTERRYKTKQMLNGINTKSSLIMGLGQACGVLPGLSRSGTTIAFGGLANVDRENNANFTFLMSIPIIICAAGLEGVDCIKNGVGDITALPFVVGMITAMVTGYIAIKFMLKIIKKADYKWFSLYLLFISVINLIF